MHIRPANSKHVISAVKRRVPSKDAARDPRDSDGSEANTEQPPSGVKSSRGLDGKLQRLRDVQHAFALALRAAQAIESRYLLDPII